LSATKLNVRAGVPGQLVGKILNDKIGCTTLPNLCWLAGRDHRRPEQPGA